MIRSTLELRQAEHDAMAKAMAEFEARGGPVVKLPIGLMADTDPNYDRKAAAKKAGKPGPEVLPPSPVHRVPNVETFSPTPVYKGPKRGKGTATSRAAVPSAPVPVLPGIDRWEPGKPINAWTRIAAVLRASNRPLYMGEIRLITGLPTNNIGVALANHAAELEYIGKPPLRQYKLRSQK